MIRLALIASREPQTMEKPVRASRIISLTKWMLLIASAILLAPIALAAIRAWHEDLLQRPRPRLASDEDWRAIVDVVFGKQAPLVLVSSSEVLCAKNDPYIPQTQFCLNEPPPSVGITSWWVDARIPLKLRRELVMANTTAKAVPNPDGTRYVLAREDEVLAAIRESSGWEGFRKRFPAAEGTIVVSRATLSEDGTQALIYGEFHSVGFYGHGDVYLLQRGEHGWKVLLRSQMWVS